MQDRAATIQQAQQALTRAVWGTLEVWTQTRGGEPTHFREALDDAVAGLAADLASANGALDDLMEGELVSEGPSVEQIGKGGGRRG